MGILTGVNGMEYTSKDIDACKDLVDTISQSNTFAVFTIVVAKDDQGVYFKGKFIDKLGSALDDNISDMLMDELEHLEERIKISNDEFKREQNATDEKWISSDNIEMEVAKRRAKHNLFKICIETNQTIQEVFKLVTTVNMENDNPVIEEFKQYKDTVDKLNHVLSSIEQHVVSPFDQIALDFIKDNAETENMTQYDFCKNVVGITDEKYLERFVFEEELK